MDMLLKGKVALVTGAARDVGREIALSLAAEGAAVAVNYNGSRDGAEAVVAEIEKKGGKAKAYKADVANFEEVKAKFDDPEDSEHLLIDIQEARQQGVLPIAFRGKEKFNDVKPGQGEAPEANNVEDENSDK